MKRSDRFAGACLRSSPSRPSHFLCLLLLPLALSACPSSDPGTPSSLEARHTETIDVSLASIEALVPREISSYEAWQVQRRRGLPIAIIVERFVRGECFERQLYAKGPEDTSFAPDGAVEKGRRNITPDTRQEPPKLLLTQALEKDELPFSEKVHIARHGLQRPAWSFARFDGPDNGHPVVVTTDFGYDISGCSLPPRIADSRIPARRGSSAPSKELIERTRAVWAETDRAGGSYVKELRSED